MPKLEFQVMVLGTGSHAGKSLVATALCRILSDQGLKVAPYKAQNMALNSGVTVDGAEIGRAQILQAEAARCVASGDMNPVLLKPLRGRGSQVIVHGKARGVFSTREYFRFWPKAAKAARDSYEELSTEYQALVIEGAGSPAEVNLAHRDLANLETAKFSGAPWILVVDVERGGSFASVLGTLQLVPKWMRPRFAGVVFNKFRGDASLMDPGVAWLKKKHGIRTLGIIPWLDGLSLDQEDSLGAPDPGILNKASRAKAPLVEILLLPSLANMSDLEPLRRDPNLQIRYRRLGQAVEGDQAPDLIVLAGSKHTLDDMRQMNRSGESGRIRAWADAGSWVLGICGGFQMLGTELSDRDGVDGKAVRSMRGLGLLDAKTRMASLKITTQTRTRVRSSLGDFALIGYEIHHGRTSLGDPSSECALDSRPLSPLLVQQPGGRIWGSYLHGILDNDGFRRAFLKKMAHSRKKNYVSTRGTRATERESEILRWTAHVSKHLQLASIPGFPR